MIEKCPNREHKEHRKDIVQHDKDSSNQCICSREHRM